MPQSGTVSLLFSDLVNSTGHLQHAGDEEGQRFFGAHHKLISDAIAASGGEELQWLGDGVLAAFDSSADAVLCAIRIEQTARRPVANMKFEIRIGIHCGEALRRDGGYSGATVVVARKLCDAAEAGQILCSRIVADLLSARETFRFRDLGQLTLKGLSQPVAACEALYDRNDPIALLNRTPFVGRAAQLGRLVTKLELACNGHGSVVTVTGEPGIGKTRALEEFSDMARQHRATVLRGACYDGEFQPPYGAFAELVLEYVRAVPPQHVEAVMGASAATISKIAPSIRRYLGEIREPPTLDRDEERFRLLDAIAQWLIALARKTPLVVILDDLHWADRGTVAMLNHVAHFVTSSRILVVGAYRDAEVGSRHPLSAAIAGIRRGRDFETIALEGLASNEVGELLGIIGDQAAPGAFVDTIRAETSGNPFFIREVLLHLVEEGKILREGQDWISQVNLKTLAIPDGVREIIGRRVMRLSEDGRKLLSIGAAFKGEFSFDVAAEVAGLSEETALGAIDEALEAQLLRPGVASDKFDFTHALIRHTLYSELNPARRVRLHRQIAEEMERQWGERAGEHAAEVAYHFWRGASAQAPANRGVDYSIAAADQAEAACAYDEAVAFIRIALELLPPKDLRRAKLLARLSLSLAWTLDGEGSCTAAREASVLVAEADGSLAAAKHLEEIVRALYAAGLARDSWKLATEGLRLLGDRRDVIWASLREIDLFREEAEDPKNPGIRVDSPGQREWRSFLRTLPREVVKAHGFDPRYESRAEIIGDITPNPATLLLLAGDYRRALPLWQKEAGDAESKGRIGWAVTALGNTASCHIALGDFEAARAVLARGATMAARASSSVAGRMLNLNLVSAHHELRVATDEGWEALLENAGSLDVLNKPTPENNWAFAMIRACGAYFFARINQPDIAMEWIGTLEEAYERGAAWEPTYSAVVCDAAAALWMLNRYESASTVERCVRNKVIAPDFRYPMRDGRLSLARLCALQGRYDEASEWFAQARTVLDDQGARPLRALADYDEGQMYLRAGDGVRARRLLSEASRQFDALGMNGWRRRLEETIAAKSTSLSI